MVQYYDSHLATAFEEALIESNIPFEKFDDQFHYPVSHREKVKEISSKILEANSSKNLFVFQQEKLFDKTKKALDEAGIEYQVIERDEGSGISWTSEYDAETRKIIKAATGIPL